MKYNNETLQMEFTYNFSDGLDRSAQKGQESGARGKRIVVQVQGDATHWVPPVGASGPHRGGLLKPYYSLGQKVAKIKVLQLKTLSTIVG